MLLGVCGAVRYPGGSFSGLEERMPAVSRVTSLSEWLLRQSFVWGGLACLAFYAAIFRLTPEDSFWLRYFAGHQMAYCATALFFIGIAGLIIKALGLSIESAMVSTVKLPTDAVGNETVADVPRLLQGLHESTSSIADHYLVRRLREALQFVQRKGSADSVEQQLRYLEETDLARMSNSYGLTRIIASTIPILGFLGTVIGITLAIAKLNLSGQAVDQSLPAVVAGLSVAFYTTAQALGLSIILLFGKYCVERIELRLLAAVDDAAASQLIGRFQQYGAESDPGVASIAMMSERLLKTVESGFVKQAALLQENLQRVGEHQEQAITNSSEWSAHILSEAATSFDEAIASAIASGLARYSDSIKGSVGDLADKLDGTLVRHAELLNEGLDQHTAALAEAESKLAQENRRHLGEVEAAVGEAMLVATTRQEKLIRQSETLLKEMQVALVDAAGTTVAQQEHLIKQGDILLKVVEATGQVTRLEESLNANLTALASTHNFEKSVAGLGAVLQLLSARLGEPTSFQGVDLSSNEHNKNQAA